MSKKFDYFVYSVFSTELQNYPYYPFIAKTHSSALNKFFSFISNRDTVCEGAVLHCIGTCRVNSEGVIIDGSLQPFAIPFEVDFKNNVLTKSYILGKYYIDLVSKYLIKLINNHRKEFNCGKNRKK